MRPAISLQAGKVTTHTVIGPGHNHSRVIEHDGTINISQSKVKSWRQCRRQFHFKYVEMLIKKKVKRPFTFGRIAHEMIEADAEGDLPFELLDNIELEKGAYFRREIEMYGNIIDDLRVIMTEYFEHWKDHDMVYIRRNHRSSEHEFRIELMPGLWFTGRIDGAARSRRMKWLIEHKSYGRLPNEDERWRAVQTSVYYRALEMIGWTGFDGVLWDYISSKPPSVPEVLKNGGLSIRKISTLPTKLEEFFAETEAKVDAKQKRELIDAATANRSEYFQRIYNPIKPDVVGIIWDDFLETAMEIATLIGKVKSRNIGRHCSWCDYEPLCRAEMTGSDVDFLKEREYVVEDGNGDAITPDED